MDLRRKLNICMLKDGAKLMKLIFCGKRDARTVFVL